MATATKALSFKETFQVRKIVQLTQKAGVTTFIILSCQPMLEV